SPSPLGRDGEGPFVDCVTCHMPKNSTIDIPHVITTDHFIRVPVKENEVKKIKEFVTLVCINKPNADAKSRGEAFLNYFEKFESNPASLDSAKRYFKDATNDDVKNNFKDLIHWSYLKNDFAQTVSYTERMTDALSILTKKSYS